ncbi:4736_t:CDS:2 [Funneliformis geosporum]|nr:4736_t:CDS:2 [Funneliformis geosporum]
MEDDGFDDNVAVRKRIIGILAGIGMNVNNVIGSGIFTTPGMVWKSLNSPQAAMILWAIGGIISMAGSLTYAELGASINRSGGESAYLKVAYTKPKNFISYLFSFMFIVAIRPGSISAVLQAVAQYLWYIISDDASELNSKKGWESGWPFWRLKLISIITLAIITGYHMYSTRLANYINQTFAVIKMMVLTIIAIAGLVKLPSVLSTHPNNWLDPIEATRGFKDFSFSFILVDLLVNVAFISVVPRELIIDIEEFNEVIAADFFMNLFGKKAGRILSLFIIISAIDYIPYFSEQLKWKATENSPKFALLAQFIWCSLLIVLVGGGISSDSFILFSNFSQYSAWIFYMLTGIGLLSLRYYTSRYRLFKIPNPIVCLFVLGGVYISIFSYFVEVTCPTNEPKCDLKHQSLKRQAPYFISLGFLVLGTICYYFAIYRVSKNNEIE